VGQFEPRFQGKGSSLGDLFWLTENWTHFAIFQGRLHHPAFSRFDTIPACDRQTDRTDGIAIASTALSACYASTAACCKKQQITSVKASKQMSK